MTTILPLIVRTFTAGIAPGEFIHCTFTEPFFYTHYNFAERTLTVDAFQEKTRVLKNVSFEIVGAGRFNLVDEKGNVLQELSLTMKGSDGMSDIVYPFEVRDLRKQSGIDLNYGGCTSKNLGSTGHDHE